MLFTTPVLLNGLRSIGDFWLAVTPMKKATGSSRTGILAGGNWIIDQVKMIDVYPQREQLANIREQSEGTGGAPFNVVVNLAKLNAPFALSAARLVGKV